MIEWKLFSNPPAQRATLLVITSDDMLSALVPFADHKRPRGCALRRRVDDHDPS